VTVLPALHEWEGFYVIVGSSAAALTGLMFVVVALSAEARATDVTSRALRAFATPTIVHFGAVLLLAAFSTTPGQTMASLRLCLLAAGVTGFGYAIFVVGQARRQQSYAPVAEDWVWHVLFPFIGYAGLVVAAFLLESSPHAALYVVGGTALLLLFAGIHNAWDSAVWLTERHTESKEKEP
jgi:hypothetical protein